MSNTQLRGQTLALAGIFQSVDQVGALAKQGSRDLEPFEVSIGSVFRIDARDADDVYGGVAGLKRGLSVMCEQLGGDKRKRNLELLRYAADLMRLERMLGKRPDLMQAIGEGVRAGAEQAAYFSETHENVLARLADIYTNTVSTLYPRVMVSGERQHLENPANANGIRALLLAGIRSAVLWRQCGGGRLALLLGRRRMLGLAEQMLAEIRETAPC